MGATKAQLTYTDWLRTHTWAQIMDPKTTAALEWRWTRSSHLAEHGVVAYERNYAGHIRYQVNSESDPTRHYDLTLEAGCECPDAYQCLNGQLLQGAPFGWCKHLFAAWRYQQWLTRECNGGSK